MWFGIILVIVGVLLLLKTLGVPITGNLWGIFWALILVAIGASIITRRTKWGQRWDFLCWHQQYRRQREAVEALKRRYARGEITKEEFERTKRDLSEE
ncbi:MAG: SHOCT domain-containing protein [bacterium]